MDALWRCGGEKKLKIGDCICYHVFRWCVDDCCEFLVYVNDKRPWLLKCNLCLLSVLWQLITVLRTLEDPRRLLKAVEDRQDWESRISNYEVKPNNFATIRAVVAKNLVLHKLAGPKKQHNVENRTRISPRKKCSQKVKPSYR